VAVSDDFGPLAVVASRRICSYDRLLEISGVHEFLSASPFRLSRSKRWVAGGRCDDRGVLIRVIGPRNESVMQQDFGCTTRKGRSPGALSFLTLS
jgi:hypothetical protein